MGKYSQAVMDALADSVRGAQQSHETESARLCTENGPVIRSLVLRALGFVIYQPVLFRPG